MNAVCRTIAIALALSGTTLPTEFRIFGAGENRSTKGSVLFDETAAESVMAAFAEHGTEIMIDLEHLSLDLDGRNFNPDAQGWAKLEVRNGELWAVDVRWTPEGVERLNAAKQKYISPAFHTDDNGVVVDVMNIALTAMPATHGLTPLVASNRKPKPAAKAKGKPKRFAMADGEGGGQVAGVDIKGLAEFLGIDADPASDPAGFIQSVLAKLDEVRAKLSGEKPAEATPEAAAEMTEALSVLRLSRTLTGQKTGSQIVDTITNWKALVAGVQADQKKLEADKKALELSERSGIYAELVKLGAETPATSGLSEGKPAKHLEGMTLPELRSRRDQFKALRGDAGSSTDKQPNRAAQAPSTYKLTAREEKFCKDRNLDPVKFAETRGAIKRVSVSAPAEETDQ